MSFYTDTELNFNQGVLSYNACKNIYRSSKMGRRVIEKLVDFSMSAERDINIQKAPPEAVKQFKDTAKFLEQEESIKQCLYLSRIYGTGALYMALYDKEEEENDYTTKPNFENAERYKIKFTALDPMNISGSRVDLDPASFNFLEVIDIKVNSKPIPKKRIAVVHALKPLYLDNRTSLIPFTPPSVFYNMVDLLKDYDNAIEALDNLLYKAGAIIYKYPAKSKISGVLLNSIQASANILEQKKNGSVIAISNDSSIEDFPINNVSGLIDSLNKLENAITAALNDTPATILFDKSLSNGFSEGDKDKETEISTIETFRENKLKPLYTLTDYYVMLSAWDNTFIEEMKAKYPALQYKTNAGIFREWAESFTYEFGNLFPEPESVKQDNNAKKLDNLKRAKELGANLSDLEEELNESEIFTNEITLDESNLENEAEGEEEEVNFNEPLDIGGIKADADFEEEEHKRDKDGKFTKGGVNKENEEIKEKIDKLKNIDWNKDNILPNFPKSFLKKQGLEDKPILLKKNIIERNKQQHPDITEEKTIKILGNALYKTEVMLKGKSKRPDYYNLITRTDDKHNDLVTVELSNEKDNYEIVHFFIIRNTTRKKYEDDDKELNKS